ncbi:unnamed protein product [Soboliphyme baturini]|uniref:Serine/threonine-protein phosphatase 4 regulatory subunit 2 n=1 Tax=Soboliphyme baturini TaxID=241478 RepID=A0A183J4A8_9BILA|nr:unnamed protein product [Soboliphyme baturini]
MTNVSAALRLFRRIVQLKDEVYNSYIIGEQHFGPIIQRFRENGNKYNLLNSAFLELFEFIRVDDIKSLCAHIVEKYIDEFKDVDYVKTFQSLALRYEQQKDRLSSANSSSGHMMSGQEKDQREADELEEQWFNNDDEESWDSDLPSGSVSVTNVPFDDSLPFAPNSDSVVVGKGVSGIDSNRELFSASGSGDNGAISNRPLSPSANKSPTTASDWEPEFPSLLRKHEGAGVILSVFLTEALVDYDFDDSDEEDEIGLNESTEKVSLDSQEQPQPLPPEVSLESPRKRLCLEGNTS